MVDRKRLRDWQEWSRAGTEKDSVVDKIKDHAGGRKDHADRAGHESMKNEDVCVVATGGLGNRC